MNIDIGQLEFIEPLLRSMVKDIEHHYGVKFTVTSLYRIDNADSVHGQLPLRGIDLRCPDEAFGTLVARYTNSKYQYDPDRVHKVCCMYHAVSGGAPHLHFQVHPNTLIINQ